MSLTTQDLNKLWSEALSKIEASVSPANFSTWFKGTYVIKHDEGTIFLGVPNIFAKDWLYQKFHNSILRILRDIDSEIRALEYVIVKDADRKREEARRKSGMGQPGTPTISMPLQDFYVNAEDNLNPRYVFDSFVVGPFNELAHAASKAVVKGPGQVYNPLFIYGNTGVGKTHLIQAVGNHIKQEHPNKKVFYLTSERFGSEYFSSLQNNKVQQFKDKYRKYDVLIMDDIQFFSSKEKFQEELFHLFNTFRETNRQLVFTSDKHPNVIPGLEDRLKSRFSAGMIVDIPTPDHESRSAIFKKKAALNNLIISEEIADYLAQNIDSNVREIEGVVNAIVCQSQLKQKELSLLDIKNLIKNTAKPKKNVSIVDVIKTIASFYNINEESVYDKTRKKEVVKPRQVIMYILREDFNVSFPSIGEKLGGRDHTTVIHSCEKVKEEIKTNNVLLEEIGQIRSLL